MKLVETVYTNKSHTGSVDKISMKQAMKKLTIAKPGKVSKALHLNYQPGKDQYNLAKELGITIKTQKQTDGSFLVFKTSNKR